MTDKQDERLLTPEEMQIIIRQHNEARIKPSRTELALIEAQLAKIDKLKLDRPELREQISKISIGYTEEHHLYIDRDGLAMNQILALIPDEEEIRKQTREMTLREVGEWYENYLRSFGVGDEMIAQNTALQALKQGKLGG